MLFKFSRLHFLTISHRAERVFLPCNNYINLICFCSNWKISMFKPSFPLAKRLSFREKSSYFVFVLARCGTLRHVRYILHCFQHFLLKIDMFEIHLFSLKLFLFAFSVQQYSLAIDQSFGRLVKILVNKHTFHLLQLGITKGERN